MRKWIVIAVLVVLVILVVPTLVLILEHGSGHSGQQPVGANMR